MVTFEDVQERAARGEVLTAEGSWRKLSSFQHFVALVKSWFGSRLSVEERCAQRSLKVLADQAMEQPALLQEHLAQIAAGGPLSAAAQKIFQEKLGITPTVVRKAWESAGEVTFSWRQLSAIVGQPVGDLRAEWERGPRARIGAVEVPDQLVRDLGRDRATRVIIVRTEHGERTLAPEEFFQTAVKLAGGASRELLLAMGGLMQNSAVDVLSMVQSNLGVYIVGEQKIIRDALIIDQRGSRPTFSVQRDIRLPLGREPGVVERLLDLRLTPQGATLRFDKPLPHTPGAFSAP